MGKILEAIATDHLCVEPVIYEGDSKFNRARSRYCSLGEKLMAKLNEEEQKMLDDYPYTKTMITAPHRPKKAFSTGMTALSKGSG